MATTYDKASLVMIPSGYKDDKLYSVKPTDGSGDFTFSRDGAGASPATRVNASGLIEKGRENLILQSNNFGTTWTTSNASVTSGQSGYDGSSDAWLLEKSAANAFLFQTTTFANVQSISIYAKAGSLNWININVGGATYGGYFDLANGVTGSNIGSPIATKITDVGGGWYRCEASGTYSGTTSFRIYPADANGVTSGTSGNIYIQDAQLEAGLVATAPAIETTTAPVSAGLLGDMPRLDYSGGATCPSLLLEPSRTNAFLYSEYSAGIEYNNVNSITNNAGISPEGVQNALEIDANANDITDSYRNVGSGVVATFSVFAKAVTGDSIRMAHTATGSSAYADFNLTSGTKGTTGGAQYIDADIEEYGNGWYRCYITFTSGTGAYINRITFQDTGTYQLYGFQLEAGSYPTSYIPTYGSASGRAADVCNKTSVPSLIGTTESSIFFDVVFNGLANTSGGIGAVFALLLEAGSGGERASVVFNGTKSLSVTLRDNSVDVASVASSSNYLVEGTRYKIGIAYSLSGLNVYVNGSLLGTDSVPSLPTLQDIYINDYKTSGLYQGAIDVNQVLLFKQALTNAELAALTA